MALPNNGDRIIRECPNCEAEFEENQPVGKFLHCPADEGGCGWRFKVVPKKGMRDDAEEKAESEAA